MRHHRLFAAGLAAALMLGAASPALAGPGKAKGKADAPGQTKQKPKKPAEKPKKAKKTKKTKKTKSGVSGGGVVANGEFSIQARLRDIKGSSTSTSKGHFNYTSTDGTFKIRCRGFDSFIPDLAAKSAAVPFKNCKITGQPTVTTLTVNVIDRGEPAETPAAQPTVTPPAMDWIGFDISNPATAVVTSYSGDLVSGNIKVR